MKSAIGLLILTILLPPLNAQTNLSFPLWPDGAPGALGKELKDNPTLTVFLPDSSRATGAAMVICPGGGYGHLADHEGSHYARWFNEQGIAGFVLKYRLGPNGYRHPAMLHDVARAMRTVRARAGEWKLDAKRVGIVGSSAGGHLASTLMTHWDSGESNSTDVIERQSSRPDLAILCYAVISMSQDFTHQGSRANLLGTNLPTDLLEKLSAELQVNSNTPPCFIWSTADDKTVPIENSLELAKALRRAKVPFDLHVYASGPHGLGLGNRDFNKANFHPWTMECERWLKQNGFAR